MRAYPDSCVLIYLVEQQAPWARSVVRRVMPTQGIWPSLVFSDLTRLECRTHPMKTADLARLAVFDQMFQTRGYETCPMPAAVYDEATRLRAEHGLKTPDALHLAAALHAGCDEFWTHDQRLQRAAQGRIAVVSDWND
jgi:predicted nucleic acid-binding protein